MDEKKEKTAGLISPMQFAQMVRNNTSPGEDNMFDTVVYLYTCLEMIETYLKNQAIMEDKVPVYIERIKGKGIETKCKHHGEYANNILKSVYGFLNERNIYVDTGEEENTNTDNGDTEAGS